MSGRTKSWSGIALVMVAVLAGGCSLFKPKLCRNSKYVESQKEQGVAFYQKGNYIEALKALKEGEKCDPKDPQYYYWIGMTYLQRHRPHDAMEYFQKSIDKDNNYTEGRMALGVVLLSLNKWDEAIEQFEVAVADEFFTRPWEAYSNLAWAYLQKGDQDLAEVNANKAIEQNPQFCPAYCNRGEIYSRKGQKQKAVLEYEKAVRICKDQYARPHYLLGLEFGELGHLDKACEELGKAASVQGAPEVEQAYEYMGLYNCQGVIHRPTSQ